MKPRPRHSAAILKTALIAAAALTLTGCLTDSDYDLSNYNGPPFSYVGPRPVVTQKYVYDCKRTRLGGEYCTPRAVGQPYSYDHFIPY